MITYTHVHTHTHTHTHTLGTRETEWMPPLDQKWLPLCLVESNVKREKGCGRWVRTEAVNFWVFV